MAARNRRTDSRSALLAAACALACFVAPLSAATASAAPDTIAAAPDTTAAAPAKTLWTMDELKGVIGGETGGITGEEYRDLKSGRVAMLCALLVPGLGQMYNEKPFKAALAMGLETFYLSQIFMNLRFFEREKAIRETYPEGSSEWNYHDGWATEYHERSVDWTWWSGAVIFAVVIDAYVDAKLDDMRFKVGVESSGAGVGVSLLVPY
jgi:TM2 domain-containing membrane protein YozV